MAEDRTVIKINEGELGVVQIADEVITIIAGLATTEVEGVSSMAGNITNELVAKLGMKNLSKGVKIEVIDDCVIVYVSINVAFGANVPEVSRNVQEKVANAINSMTGITVSEVNVKIAGLDMENE